MTMRREPDPLEALRAVNPVDDNQLPSASLARIRARVQEDVMTTGATGRRVPRLLATGIGVAAVGVLALIALLGGRDNAAGTPPGSSIGPGSAACVEQYSTATLANRTIAFDGTVSAIAGDRVTFAVNHAYRGVTGTTVTLDATGMTGTTVTSAGGPNLTMGERYLVAGEATFVWSCGFTQPYEPDVAVTWSRVFEG
jgi:hypothetical protein